VEGGCIWTVGRTFERSLNLVADPNAKGPYHDNHDYQVLVERIAKTRPDLTQLFFGCPFGVEAFEQFVDLAADLLPFVSSVVDHLLPIASCVRTRLDFIGKLHSIKRHGVRQVLLPKDRKSPGLLRSKSS